jgi:hypothetical protein
MPPRACASRQARAAPTPPDRPTALDAKRARSHRNRARREGGADAGASVGRRLRVWLRHLLRLLLRLCRRRQRRIVIDIVTRRHEQSRQKARSSQWSGIASTSPVAQERRLSPTSFAWRRPCCEVVPLPLHLLVPPGPARVLHVTQIRAQVLREREPGSAEGVDPVRIGPSSESREVSCRRNLAATAPSCAAS